MAWWRRSARDRSSTPRRRGLGALTFSLPSFAEPPAAADTDPAAAPSDAAGDNAGSGEQAADGEEMDMAAFKAAIDAKLKWQSGDVVVGEGLATLKLGEDWRYLDPEQAAFVLTELWGNPPGGTSLGMVFPKDQGPIDDNSWAVVVDYNSDGYIEDDDADDIDYGEMLEEMQAEARESNAERKQAGYPAVDVVGWAEPPRYDKATRKLYWAKELDFEGQDKHILNYDVRILGRRGFLVMQAVSEMPQLTAIQGGMQDLLARAEFKEGNRYEDFDPDLDEVAAYGIGALVAGKLAAKTGLLAALGVMLLKAKKLLIIGGIAVVAVLRKVFGGKGDAE